MKNIFSIVFLLLLSANIIHKAESPQNRETELEFIFHKIELGFAKGNVKEFSGYFNSRTYISLEENTTGYFSSNQSYYVLSDFFEKNVATKFEYKHKVLNGDNPYAYGELEFVSPNKRGKLKVFISLEYIFTDWKITQITIS